MIQVHKQLAVKFCNCRYVVLQPNNKLLFFMYRSRTHLPRLSFQALAHCRGYSLLRRSSCQNLCIPQPHRPSTPDPRWMPSIKHSNPALLSPTLITLARCSYLSTQKYNLIYSLPHMKILRTVSRLKLLQTGITMVVLPPVFYMYLHGDASYFLVTYSTGIAAFAAVMLYTASYYLRRVIGKMYLDESQTMLKVSHMTFWGRRKDEYLQVTDVMTLGDTGDSAVEPILKLKRYSSSETLYFSIKLGRVVDRQAFEKVFGTLI
uniref:Transmembrane protein 186 n=2 Tax=Esox lucius TaxID=8010 RepID=A0A3P9ALV8_ESOLU